MSSKPSIKFSRVLITCGMYIFGDVVVSALAAYPLMWTWNWAAAHSKEPLTTYGHVFGWCFSLFLIWMAFHGVRALFKLQREIEKGEWDD